MSGYWLVNRGYFPLNQLCLFIYLFTKDWLRAYVSRDPTGLWSGCLGMTSTLWPSLWALRRPGVWCQDMPRVTKISSFLPDALLCSSGAAEWNAAWRNLPLGVISARASDTVAASDQTQTAQSCRRCLSMHVYILPAQLVYFVFDIKIVAFWVCKVQNNNWLNPFIVHSFSF